MIALVNINLVTGINKITFDTMHPLSVLSGKLLCINDPMK